MSPLKIEQGASSHSAYDLRSHMSEVEESHTIAVLVANEAGVLARVIGLFSGRGYNIESLTVAEVDHEGHRSRITIVTSGTPQIIHQIKMQLERMVPVYEVSDLTVEGPYVGRELALIKVISSRRTPGPRPCASPKFSAPTWWTARSPPLFSKLPAHPKRSTPLPS